MNYAAQPLQSHEIQAMRRDKDVMARVLQSYRIMLDFYGMQLVSPDTGLIARAEPESKYEERYRNLIRTFPLPSSFNLFLIYPPFISYHLIPDPFPPVDSQHNFLRISRILKHLSEMGLERLNAGFLLHVLNEQSEHDQLNTRALRDSMDRWWANCIRDDGERAWVGGAIRRVRDGGRFMREDYVRALERRRETGRLGEVGQEEVAREGQGKPRKEEDSEESESEEETEEEEE